MLTGDKPFTRSSLLMAPTYEVDGLSMVPVAELLVTLSRT